MPKHRGITIESDEPGGGAEAAMYMTVVADLSFYLNHGEKVRELKSHEFRLTRGEVIAGLLKGMLGMRVGGRRRIRISPHLAYGEKGGAGVPPHAVLIVDVELIAATESNGPHQ